MFTIEELILKGYTRLTSGLGDYIHYIPREKTQFIIGTNGSGKSSILSEMSPLPADKVFYKPDGYKIVKVRKDGIPYELTSKFSPKVHHSFVNMDTGEELNPGGTGAVQKDLCKQYFDITPQIHAFILGSGNNNRFSTMTTPQRREWLTRLSSVDYTYAIKYYNRLKEKHRDTLGAIKHLNGVIANYANKRLSDTERDTVEERLSSLEVLRTKLLNDKPVSEVKDIGQLLVSIKGTKKLLEAEMANARRTSKKIRRVGVGKTLDDLKHRYSAHVGIAYSLYERRDKLENELYARDAKLKSMSVTTSDEQDKIREEINNLIKNEDRLKLRLTNQDMLGELDKSPEFVVSKIKSLEDLILESLSNLPANPTNDEGYLTYSKVEMEKVRNKIIELNSLISENTPRINEVREKVSTLTEIRSHNDCTCPECNYNWVKDFDEKAFEDFKQLLSSLTLDNDARKESLKTFTEKLNGINEYFNAYRSFKSIFDTNPDISPLFDKINRNGQEVLLRSPLEVMTIVRDYIRDMEILCLISSSVSKRGELEKTLSVETMLSEMEYNREKDAIDKMTEDYWKLRKQREDMEKPLSLLKSTIESYESLLSSMNNVDKLANQLEKEEVSFEDSLISTTYTDLIQLADVEISKLREIKYASDTVESAISTNQSSLNELLIKEKNYKRALQALSPTEGLIAKGLVGYINGLVQEMNSFIKKIWTYPLEIKNCDFSTDEDGSKDDLNYKFSMESNGAVIEDISMGSSAMREIIDLAFRVVAYKYLGIHDYPLFLDEFGNFFDHAHKKSALNAIINIMIQSSFSQVFIISHDATSYGSIPNAGLTVTCDKNVLLPPGIPVNTNLILTK